MILIAAFALIFLTLLFFAYKILESKNYVAFFLLIPYVILMLYMLPELYKYSIESKVAKTIVIKDMSLIDNLSIEETVAVTMRSKITFGDGLQCAGGLINSDSTIKKILSSRNISTENMTMIWLLNSKASRLSIQNSTLFVSDQEKAKSGIWVGWIDSKEVSKIRKMDGVNL